MAYDDTLVPEDGVVNVVAIDSGSGSIKVGIAHVDSITHEIYDIVADQIKIQLAKDLEDHVLMQEIIESGKIHNLYDIEGLPLNMCGLFDPNLDQGDELLNTIAPMCSKEAHDFLEGTYANKFSEAIKDIYISKLTSVVSDALKLDPKHPTEVWLVGTAALRKADDGQFLVDALSHKINDELHLNTHFKIISQQDEGIYAFEGGVATTKLPAEKTISWDIGGGSMQITGKVSPYNYQVLGGTVASSTFKATAENYLIKMGTKTAGDSIYPLSDVNVQDLITLAKKEISFESDKEQWFAEKKSESGVEIIGIGNIHSSLHGMMILHLGNQNSVYTKEDVYKLIKIFSNKDDSEIKASLVPKSLHAFAGNYLTNAILVAATMEKYNIDQVQVVPISNINTMLYKAANR